MEGIARAIEEVVALPDPIGAISAEWERPNGLRIQRVRVPLGIIGIIYESRPNVTADAGALWPEVRQCGHPTWRIGRLELQSRDPCVPGLGSARSGITGDLRSAGSDY